MELKRFIPFAILPVAICVPFLFLLWKDSGWQSLVFLCVFLIAGTIFIVKKNHAPLFASILSASHLLHLSGIEISRFFVFFMLIVCEIFLLFYKPLPIDRTLKFLLAGIPLYFAIVLIVKPYQIHFSWLFLFAEVLLMVIITLYFNWDSKSIEQTITLHLCFLLIFGLCEIFWFPRLRIEGPIASASAYGVIIAVEWAIWLGFQVGRPILRWRFFVPMVASTLVVILATGTRMALLAFGLSLFMASFVRNTIQEKSLVKIVRFLLISGILIGLTVELWQVLPENLVVKKTMQSLIHGKLDGSNRLRILAWMAGLDAIKNYPVWGIGNGNFSSYLCEFASRLGAPQSFVETLAILPHPHNFYLRTFAENGFFGLLYLIFLIVFLFKNIFFSGPIYKCNIKIGFLFGFICLSILGLFDSVPFYEWTMIWGGYIIALTFALPRENIS